MNSYKKITSLNEIKGVAVKIMLIQVIMVTVNMFHFELSQSGIRGRHFISYDKWNIVTVVYLAEIWIHVFHIRLVIAKLKIRRQDLSMQNWYEYVFESVTFCTVDTEI